MPKVKRQVIKSAVIMAGAYNGNQQIIFRSTGACNMTSLLLCIDR